MENDLARHPPQAYESREFLNKFTTNWPISTRSLYEYMPILGLMVSTGGSSHGRASAQYARVDSGLAAVIPPGLSFTDAAAVMESLVTAWEALSNLGRIAEGETVLIHAAAGGTGSAAVQLAKSRGAIVLATASRNNIKTVLALGADFVFDYKVICWVVVTRPATNFWQ